MEKITPDAATTIYHYSICPEDLVELLASSDVARAIVVEETFELYHPENHRTLRKLICLLIDVDETEINSVDLNTGGNRIECWSVEVKKFVRADG